MFQTIKNNIDARIQLKSLRIYYEDSNSLEMQGPSKTIMIFNLGFDHISLQTQNVEDVVDEKGIFKNIVNINDLKQGKESRTTFELFRLSSTKIQLEININKHKLVSGDFYEQLKSQKIQDIGYFGQQFVEGIKQKQDSSFVLASITSLHMDVLISRLQ